MSLSKITVPTLLSPSFPPIPSRSRAHAPSFTLPFSVIEKLRSRLFADFRPILYRFCTHLDKKITFHNRQTPNEIPPEKLTKKPDKTPEITRLYCVRKPTEKELETSRTLTGQGL